MDASNTTMFADFWAKDLAAMKADRAPLAPVPVATDPLVVFGFVGAEEGGYALPTTAVALQAVGNEHHAALIDMLKTMSVPPKVTIWAGERRAAFYRLAEPALTDALAKAVPDGVTLVREGQLVDLTGFSPDDHAAKSIADLSELTAPDVAALTADPLNTRNPLLPYSLRGQSERFQRMAVEARPLLGEVCLRGQVTVWYAAPNSGKTLVALSLVIEAVREGRIAAGNVFYVNADDNGQGFAAKLQLMDDIGANTLAPGFQGFAAEDLIPLLHKMADQDQARGLLLVIDTTKKFVDLMSKLDASKFAQACRRVAMMGGSVLGLAHTTKNANSDGSPRYAGTTDLVDDADAAYTLRLLDGGIVGEKVVEFRCFKSRGECAESAAYAFAVEKGLTYDEKLASVRPVEAEQLDQFQRVEAQRSDSEVIEAVAACIREGINTKMSLAKTVAARINISGREATRVIERYTGDDPARYRWRFRRGDRSALLFELLPEPAPMT